MQALELRTNQRVNTLMSMREDDKDEVQKKIEETTTKSLKEMKEGEVMIEEQTPPGD